MLIKVGDIVLNSLQILYIDLSVEQEEIPLGAAVGELFPVHGEAEIFPVDRPSPKTRKSYGVQVTFLGEVNLFFWDEEAEALRWYFTHPTSDVVDIQILKG